MIHQLKIIDPYYSQVRHNEKKFEYRKNDRGFIKGDILILNPHGNAAKDHAPVLAIIVKEIIYGPDFGIPADYCIMYWSNKVIKI